MKASYLMSDVDDATRLRESFERGAQWTREEADRIWGWNDRRFRLAVAELRDSGYPVVSESERGSVYRKARTREEAEAFIDRELVSRTRKLEDQIRAMRAGVDKHFGTPQLPLAI